MKTCNKCKLEKQESCFSKCKNTKDGMQYRCKSCFSEYNAKRYASNPDKFIAYQAAYKAENPCAVKSSQARYYAENSERIKAWKSENKERIASSNRKWQKENPDKKAAHNRNRRARVRSAEGSHTAADVRTIFDNQRGLCANCQTKLLKSGANNYHVDHIIPLSRGGSNWPSNLQCLCPSCNLSKNAKDPIEWAAANGRLL